MWMHMLWAFTRCVFRTFACLHFFSFFSFCSSFLLKVLRPTLNDHGRSKGWSLSLQRPPSLVCFCCQISFLYTLQSSLCTHSSLNFLFSFCSFGILCEIVFIVSIFNKWHLYNIMMVEPRCLIIDGVTLGRKGLNQMGSFYFMWILFVFCFFFIANISFFLALGRKMLSATIVFGCFSQRKTQIQMWVKFMLEKFDRSKAWSQSSLSLLFLFQ